MRIVHLENRAVAHNRKTPNRKEMSLFILVFEINSQNHFSDFLKITTTKYVC
jgi:hypothetical protein